MTKRFKMKEIENKIITTKEIQKELLSNCITDNELRRIDLGFGGYPRNKKKIEDYIAMFPHHKLITDRGIDIVLKKYGLIKGRSFDFIGEIPDRNLKDIEQFKKHYVQIRWEMVLRKDPILIAEKLKISVKHARELLKKGRVSTGFIFGEGYSLGSLEFDILAPVDQFDVGRKKIKKNRIIEDPIVLFDLDCSLYVIVTAWGKEASDYLVFNEKHN